MILEIADIRIHPGQQAGFEAAIKQGMATVLPRATGFIRAQVHGGIETPERYVLQIEWESVEAHNVGFRGGPLFVEWRALIGSYFAQPPHVEHFNTL